jgi:1-deoxy-D-xylulose-5-phosphate reductoisomerase
VTRKRVAILGSTGSIGTQALDVIGRHPDRFEVVALAAGRNVELLRRQVTAFKPRIASSAEDGPEGLRRVALDSDADIVLAATDGAVAFDAVLAALQRGIDIAVANKELIVAAGEIMVAAAEKSGSNLLPVDSEHSALFQCLAGEDPASVAALIVTASGGPFRTADRDTIEHATVEQALAHPTWQMGAKNTIDSATMMNKGLEVIEAARLFKQPGERVLIAVHPQSIAHGFAVFTDGSVKAQVCAPDMRIPIGYALAFPNRLNGTPAAAARPPADVLEILGSKPGATELRYEFTRPDSDRFPCVRLAYEVLARAGTAPAVLSAANEVAVRAFVEGKLRFGAIARTIEHALGAVPHRDATLESIRLADAQARTEATRYVEGL